MVKKSAKFESPADVSILEDDSEAVLRTTVQPLLDMVPVPDDEDIIGFTLDCAAALPGDLWARFPDLLKVISSEHVTHIFDGEGLYVRSKKRIRSQSLRNQQIQRDYKAGERIPLLQRRYGLSPARLWQIINPRKSL